jgi:hypothetical protein
VRLESLAVFAQEMQHLIMDGQQSPPEGLSRLVVHGHDDPQQPVVKGLLPEVLDPVLGSA